MFSPKQFLVYRAIFGCYLLFHFTRLLPDAAEVFSSNGMIKDVTNLPSFGKLPIFLFYYDHPTIVLLFITSLMFASMCLMVGIRQRLVSLWLFYGWLSLFNRNPFISNPSLAYIGWILLSFACIPSPDSPESAGWKNNQSTVFHGLWIIIPLSYTVSGLHKLQCPSWIDGSALHHILTSPLSRHNFLVQFILTLPPFFLQMMTWISLFAEISFLFLGTFKHLRKCYWFFFLGFHLGILATVNFGDLTCGMLVSHFYFFDPRWFFPKNTVESSDIMTTTTTEEQKQNKWIGRLLIFSVIGLSWWMFDETMLRKFGNLTLSSLWGFGYTVIGLFVVMSLERIFPDQRLPQSKNWWIWVLAINFFQLFAVILATLTWEKWLQQTSYFKSSTGFHLRDYVSPFMGGVLAYLINQWLFYWWHYFRHHVYLFWILFHQFHHSATRIEAITSFYKHPLEIIIDSQIMAALLYSVLGLSQESSIWLSLFSAFGEYIYHMNIKTPKFLGYFFQRPESHRLHHAQNKRIHCPNYSDFPVWDMLNGTFENPDTANEPCGFSKDKDLQRFDMLMFRDVLHHTKSRFSIVSFTCYLLLFWGVFASMGLLVHSPSSHQATVLVSSPLPLVFSSYRGVETFSTTFQLNIEWQNETICSSVILDRSPLKGSYNRRNTYGAMFAYGPFFDDHKLISMRQEILSFAICKPGVVAQEFGIFRPITRVSIQVKSKTAQEFRVWYLWVDCNE